MSVTKHILLSITPYTNPLGLNLLLFTVSFIIHNDQLSQNDNGEVTTTPFTVTHLARDAPLKWLYIAIFYRFNLGAGSIYFRYFLCDLQSVGPRSR